MPISDVIIHNIITNAIIINSIFLKCNSRIESILLKYLTPFIETCPRNVEELQLKLTKANENVSFLQRSIEELTLKAEQSQQESAKKHEEERKELLEKLLDLVRRE